MAKGFVDLHMHTVASDGTQTIAQQVRRAKERSLCCIAITDHDTISADLSARVADWNGVEVICGVEIKADFDGVAGEVLGYFVDPANGPLQELLSGMETARTERMEQMVARCRRHTGADITMDDVRALADGNLGRPHLAKALVAKGVAVSLQDAFDRFIARGTPCHVPIEKSNYRDVVNTVHQAGGAAGIAHPCLMKVEDWAAFLDAARGAGMDAVEVFYPYNHAGRGLSIDPDLFRTLADARGFLLAGGSDDHGPNSTKESMGDIRIPYERVDALKAVLPIPLQTT